LSHEVAFTTQDGPSQLTNNRLAETSYAGENESDPTARDQVLFKNDQIYCRQAQDVVNPNTPHRDIMLLANPDDLEANSNHPFLYACVLRIYHANVVYVGLGMRDYVPRRLEFLWVQWFQYFGSRSVIWKDCHLDCVRFPPMASEHMFGFVDPRDVLRGCHIMQRFAKGTVHANVIGLSRLIDDSTDWCFYYVNRCDHSFITSSHYQNINSPILQICRSQHDHALLLGTCSWACLNSWSNQQEHAPLFFLYCV
jgi:hypothetical protein